MSQPEGGPDLLLAAINCRHYHTSPGIRIFRNLAEQMGLNVRIEEFGLGDPIWKIAEAILRHKPNAVGLGLYIWNRDRIIELAECIRRTNPAVRLIAGGPELDSKALPPFDYVLEGEAEKPFCELLKTLFPKISQAPLPPGIPWPYKKDDYHELKDRIAYIETTRGCPYACHFCMGFYNGKPRTLFEADEKTLSNIRDLIASGVKCIKFLDRTFNHDPERALNWFKSLERLPGQFHFEIRAELLDETTLNFLKTITPGKFQFEIGVQSLNPLTLESIGRSSSTERLIKRLTELLELRTVHVHADLIFGLPHETTETIERGFNTVFALRPDELQLGFLKSLPGSKIRTNARELGLSFDSRPPYEILSTPTLSAHDLLELKKLEYVFNIFYNSKRFRLSLTHVLSESKVEPFRLFTQLSEHFTRSNLFRRQLGLDEQYTALFDVFHGIDSIKDYLRLDYVTSQPVNHLPVCLRIDAHPLKREGNKLLVPFEHELDQRTQAFGKPSKVTYYAIAIDADPSLLFRVQK